MTQLKSRKTIRLKNYDYSSNGYYFITLCSRDRKNLFGQLKNAVGAPLACARHDNIEWSYLGQIIDKQWNDLMIHYENIIWDDYIIMPNHIHGIIIVNKRAEASAAPTIAQIIRSFKSRSAMEYLKIIKKNKLKEQSSRPIFFTSWTYTDSPIRQIKRKNTRGHAVQFCVYPSCRRKCCSFGIPVLNPGVKDDVI